MQVHIVKQMPSVKAGYVDPQAIAQTNFNYPERWTLDAKELAAAKTLREKERSRTAKLREESFKVAAYIALAFKTLQQHSTICHTTSSKFNSILKALFDIFYLIQKSLSSSKIKFMQHQLDLYRRRCREKHGIGL